MGLPLRTDDSVVGTYVLIAALVPGYAHWAVRTGDTWLLDEEQFYKFCWKRYVTVETAIARARNHGRRIEETARGYVVGLPSAPANKLSSVAWMDVPRDIHYVK